MTTAHPQSASYGSMGMNGGTNGRVAIHADSEDMDEHTHEESELLGEALVNTDAEDDLQQRRAGQPSVMDKRRENSGLFRDSQSPLSQSQRQNEGSGGQPTSAYGVNRVLIVAFLTLVMGIFLIIFFPRSASLVIPASAILHVPFQSVDRADFHDPVEGILDIRLFHSDLLAKHSDDNFFSFPFPTGAFWTNLVVPPPQGEQFSYPAAVYPYAYRWAQNALQLSYPSSHRTTTDTMIIDSSMPDLTFMVLEDGVDNRKVTRFDPLSVTLEFSKSMSAKSTKWETTLVQGSPYATFKFKRATPMIHSLSKFKAVQCPGDDAENFEDLQNDGGGSNGDGTGRKLFGVCTIDDSDEHVTYVRGVQFILKTQEGYSWMVFTSEPVDFMFDPIEKTMVKSTEKFTGVMRVAIIPSKDDVSLASTGLRRLVHHVGVYPVGGDVTWGFSRTSHASGAKQEQDQATNATSKYATLRFNFETELMNENYLQPHAARKDLLMLALPHHLQVLPADSVLDRQHFNMTYRCIKGEMRPVIGSSWSLHEPLLDLKFDGPVSSWDDGVREVILEQAMDDLTRISPTQDEDIYGFGKQTARFAQILHVCRRLLGLGIGGVSSNSDGSSSSSSNNDNNVPEHIVDKYLPVLENAEVKLWGFLEVLFTGGTQDELLFDTKLGGLVAKHGLEVPDSDFGNGRYNDHHFHYGYILYASALMGNMNSTFVSTFGTYVDSVFADVAYYGNKDSETIVYGSEAFFPFARHKSWFDGHSFATGLFPFADGKSQESSSEAVNCYFGAYLWSLIRHGDNDPSGITDFARLMLATEIRGAQTYWHMMPPDPPVEDGSGTNSSLSPNEHGADSNSRRALGKQSQQSTVESVEIYNAEFAKSYMVGNLGMLDVNIHTWFGNNPLYVHMINVLPITAVTAILLNRDYVAKEYPYLLSKIGTDVPNSWRGYTTSVAAILDANQAWHDAQSMVSYELDSAASKTQILHWISTRPGFNVTIASTFQDAPTASPKASSGEDADGGSSPPPSSATCEMNPGCVEAKLTGLCCPTADGVMLGCC